MQPSARTLRGLDWLNFFLADVQTSVGPFLAIYLASAGWNEEQVGIALATAVISGLIAQTPAGILVDRVRSKRKVIVIAVLLLAIGAFLIAHSTDFWSVLFAQVLIGATSSFFLPAVCGISLGVVGHEKFDSRQGRNQAYNSMGNIFAALLMGFIGYFVSDRAIFLCVFVFAIPTMYSLHFIHPEEICHASARGAIRGEEMKVPKHPWELLKNKALRTFLLCVVLFHLANAAMLPLLGESSQGQGRLSMVWMSACVVVPQVVIALFANRVGKLAKHWGRKPLLDLAFGILPVRGFLYAIVHQGYLLVAIQILDGISAAIFGVVSVLVIADLTRGTGRFNFAIGMIATATGLGAACSQAIAGALAHHLGYPAGFLFLAGFALFGFLIFPSLMPETRK